MIMVSGGSLSCSILPEMIMVSGGSLVALYSLK